MSIESISTRDNEVAEVNEPTSVFTKLMESDEFKQQDYQTQIHRLVGIAADLYGYCLPEDKHAESEVPVKESNEEKPWGAYLTLSVEKLPEGDRVRKILIVRPTPDPIPDTWNPNEPFAQAVAANLQKLGTALSFQRHHKREKETWKVLAGEQGYHLTAPDKNGKPDLEEITFKEMNLQEGNRFAVHAGDTWHSLVNTGKDFLIIAETIFCQPEHPHDETDIERANDYVSNRTGKNENI